MRCVTEQGLARFGDSIVFQREGIDIGGKKGLDGLGGGLDNGLTGQIEAGVEEHRRVAAQDCDPATQAMEPGVLLRGDGLNPGGAVDVGDCREPGPIVGTDGGDQQHEGGGGLLFEDLCDGRFGDDRGRGTKGFAEFDPRIEDVPHLSEGRIGQDRAVPQGARAIFRTPLEAGDDLPAWAVWAMLAAASRRLISMRSVKVCRVTYS